MAAAEGPLIPHVTSDSFRHLRGPDGITAVIRRFGNACEVVRYAMEFYKALADLEEQYANGLAKILRSSCYTFKQHFLMQWLGNESTEEYGSLNSAWQCLGKELRHLEEHHREKARGLINEVRKPLEQAMPLLDQLKGQTQQQGKDLVKQLEAKQKQHLSDKKRYKEMYTSCDKAEDNLSKLRSKTDVSPQQLSKAELNHGTLNSNMLMQEAKYRTSVSELNQMQNSFDRQAEEIMRVVEETEIDRVKMMKKSFQVFAKTISNSGPAYLEGMQHILFSADSIDPTTDIQTFVQTHSVLKKRFEVLKFEASPRRATVFSSYSTTGQMSKQAETEAASAVGDEDMSTAVLTSVEGKLPEQKLNVGGRPDLDEERPINVPEGLTDEEEDSLRHLVQTGRANDFYGLLGAAPSATKSELAKARRQKTMQLHPDHFSGDSAAKKSATEALTLVNKVYTDVLTKDGVRSIYDQLCGFRLSYTKLPQHDASRLQTDKQQLQDLRARLKRARTPEGLLSEIDEALVLVEYYQTKLRGELKMDDHSGGVEEYSATSSDVSKHTVLGKASDFQQDSLVNGDASEAT